jgi:HEAT repeat protein
LLGDPVCSLEAARALGRTGQLSAAPALAAMLAIGSEPLVRAAAVALAEIDDAQLRSYGAHDTIVPVLSALGDGSAAARRVERCVEGALVEERVALCRVLGWLGADSAAASLVSLLAEEPVVADVAARALQRLGPVGHRQILSALRHGEGARRALLVPLVPLHFDATADLVVCLEDADPDVRARACERLGRIGNVAAVPALFDRLADVDAAVVQSATGALHALGSEETKRRTLAAMRSAEPKVRRVAVRMIGYFGWPDATPALRDALEDPDDRVRDAAIQALAFVDDPEALVLLLAAAASDDPRARASAMRTLGRVARSDATHAALLRGLSDAHAWARYYACQSLGRLGAPDSVAAILPLLDDVTGHVRVAAIEALSGFDDPRAIDALLEATRSSDPDASRAAVLGLGTTRSLRALPVILEAARSRDVATRVVALSALGSFDVPEADVALAEAARAENPTVRAAAVGMLGARPGLAASARLIALLEDDQLHDEVLAALAQPMPGRLPAILAALETTSAPLAEALVAVLSRMGRPDALAILGVALSLDRAEARRAAAAALSAIEIPIAASVLERVARADLDPEVRRLVHFALSRR